MDTLTNTRGWHPGPDGEPLIGAGELIALLHRFPNVVLWLNGHTHTNAVRPRPDPDQPGRGFWEVTTCAVVDWPCQTRLVELADSGGQLSITCTMVDHDAPLGPRAPAASLWPARRYPAPVTWPPSIANWPRTSPSAARTRAGPGPPPTGTWSS